MTDQTLPAAGGAYIRLPDGTLKLEEAPAERPVEGPVEAPVKAPAKPTRKEA